MSSERGRGVGHIFGGEVGNNFPEAAVVSVADEGDAIEEGFGCFGGWGDTRDEGETVDVDLAGPLGYTFIGGHDGVVGCNRRVGGDGGIPVGETGRVVFLETRGVGM